MARVLIGCEESGVVRDAFIAAGHDAFSCDLAEPRSMKGPHIQDDILKVLRGEPVRLHGWPDTAMFHLGDWDLAIFHPPCTYLSNSGVKHLYIGGRKENGPSSLRWQHMRSGVEFFKALLDCGIPKICIENPVMHGHAKEILGVEQSQTIQPYQFGHMEKKATCLWLKNLPLLKETNNVYEEMMKLPKKEREKVHYASPGKNRARDRSKSFEGIAAAMADQFI